MSIFSDLWIAHAAAGNAGARSAVNGQIRAFLAEHGAVPFTFPDGRTITIAELGQSPGWIVRQRTLPFAELLASRAIALTDRTKEAADVAIRAYVKSHGPQPFGLSDGSSTTVTAADNEQGWAAEPPAVSFGDLFIAHGVAGTHDEQSAANGAIAAYVAARGPQRFTRSDGAVTSITVMGRYPGWQAQPPFAYPFSRP